MWLFWLIAAGIFFVVEMATVGFLVFWLGIGALITMLSSFFIEDILIQIVIFVISSILLILLTKPLVNKFLNKGASIATNSYSIIGKNGIVLKDINPIQGTGQVKVNGEVWSAKTENEEIIPKDSEVNIIKIDGVKVVVKLVKLPAKVSD